MDRKPAVNTIRFPPMLDLFRPPPHRGPLIAAGMVVLGVGLALMQVRLDEELAAGWHAFALGLYAALALGLGLQARSDQGSPYAFQSVLLVAGLLALVVMTLRLGDAVGWDPLDARGAGLVASLWVGGVAFAGAYGRLSGACVLIGAVAGVSALLHLFDLVFELGGTAARWLLLLSATVFVVLALVERAGRYRHSVQYVNAAGLCLLAVAVTLSGGFGVLFGALPQVGFGWELILLGGGCGLVAFGAVDRQPGPAILGLLVLAAFVALGAGDGATLVGWPLLLLVGGALIVAAGLRPRSPLPPEPEAYRQDDLPLAARSVDDELTVTSVRVE